MQKIEKKYLFSFSPPPCGELIRISMRGKDISSKTMTVGQFPCPTVIINIFGVK